MLHFSPKNRFVLHFYLLNFNIEYFFFTLSTLSIFSLPFKVCFLCRVIIRAFLLKALHQFYFLYVLYFSIKILFFYSIYIKVCSTHRHSTRIEAVKLSIVGITISIAEAKGENTTTTTIETVYLHREYPYWPNYCWTPQRNPFFLFNLVISLFHFYYLSHITFFIFTFYGRNYISFIYRNFSENSLKFSPLILNY